ncbi:hypothetical protein DRE_02253 [Drechslerella stenobrocha 248]|uniref:Alpha and gamma adaptin binding protein p34 n=1 Tax=Drechslerella stenobrocha 248 TaxID=1043628 RepID=W7HXA0_9PEZI|nr:hypothetical protein DRE_02253 [Drechslerella stenobrocha 248]
MPERRILLVGRRDAPVLPFVEALTGSLPAHHPASASHAGITHSLALSTQYYSATVPIWIDELAEPIADWAAAYASKEAREVRQALGAIIYVFLKPAAPATTLTDTAIATATTTSADTSAGASTDAPATGTDDAGDTAVATTGAADDKDKLSDAIRGDLDAIARVVDACGGGRYGWDGACLAVAMPSREVHVQDAPPSAMAGEEWEDEVREFGFELVDFEAKGRNDFGEPVGMERLREALEANDWTAPPMLDLDNLDELDDDDFLAELAGEDPVDGDGNVRNGLKLEADEMEREMFGLHQAILEQIGDREDGDEADETEDDEELQVEQLEAAMQRLQAVKEMVSELPGDQKRAFAAKAVAEVMKTL